jgi:uncharacterized protein (TIGR03086 family)
MLKHIVCECILNIGGASTVTTEHTTANSAARIVRLDAEAVRATVRVVCLAGPEDMARITPCAGWTLGDLVAHMTAQHDGFAAAAAGEGADLARWQPGEPAGDPAGEYEAAAGRVLAAFTANGVLDRPFTLPEINPELRFPAAQAISFHLIDYVVHGWDVARSLGLDRYELEPDLLDAALPIARAVPDGGLREQGLVPFAPAVPVTGEASVLGRIVALLGRRPDWPD